LATLDGWPSQIGDHALAQHRPRIIFSFIGGDAGLDVVIQCADDFAFGAGALELFEQLLQ
jgi:hypothetical protein